MANIVRNKPEQFMLLTISTTQYPATDLSYLLHKHPERLQLVELTAGVAHIFYPEVSDEKCTVALLLDLDPVALVRRPAGSPPNDFALEQYVNDRPYTANSFMSAAIVKAFSTAMNGRCNNRPELVDTVFPLDIKIAVLPVDGGEDVLRSLFEPLGYEVDATRHPLDEKFPEWGLSRYFTVRLRNSLTVREMLSHLYVLIPVCDNRKHYWVSEAEIEKLVEKGAGWLPAHPARDLITSRYLKHRRDLVGGAMHLLSEADEHPAEIDEDIMPSQKIRVHDQRLAAVKEEILKSGAKKVADLGCGEGKLIRLLLAEKQIEHILGMDVSVRALKKISERFERERLPKVSDRLKLIHSSLTYRDKRLEGFDAAALVEVIEHLEEHRLDAFRRSVFGFAKPRVIIITTPNAEYNALFGEDSRKTMRHPDHRFEWTRQQFQAWGNETAGRFGYNVTFKSIGEEHEIHGSLTQMAIFNKI